jgi:hypothetical protein
MFLPLGDGPRMWLRDEEASGSARAARHSEIPACPPVRLHLRLHLRCVA